VFMARTPLGEMMMANIIGTIPGRRSERIILASHYDTKRAPISASSAPATALRPRPHSSSSDARSKDAERIHDRAAVPRRRGGSELGVARSGQHVRQPPLRRDGTAVRDA
jgi:hypothetical protein